MKKVFENSNEIILHSQNGRVIKARTMNQRKIVEAIKNHDMLFAIGPAGSGKTYTSVALAVKFLKEKKKKDNFNKTSCRIWRKSWLSSRRS